ncbi:MAG: CdaR family protein [Deltaproteobacteria bacterium]|nr:CdaR family protein [Deltaproteobacteria bacterium]
MKKFISTNLRLKFLAVVFAAALWFFVAGQSNTEVGFLIPIGYKGAPKDLVISSTPPDEVEVRVVGPKLFINNLSPSQIIAEIDLGGAREGVNTLRFKPSDIVTPMGVKVLRLRPGSVEVRMDRLESISLKVRPRITGHPEKGFEVADIIVFPKTVDVTRVRKGILKLDAVSTVPFDISGLDRSTSATVQIDIPSKYEFRSISAEKVEVKVIIRKER